jgi:hypothetical protein
MSTIDRIITEPTYWLATDGEAVFHCGYATDGWVSTGQPELQTFATLEELNAALAGYGQPAYDPNPPTVESEIVDAPTFPPPAEEEGSP